MWQIDIFSSNRITPLWKFCRKNVTPWACTRSKVSINDSMGETGVVCRLHHLVNLKYQQELGDDSSGWWRNCWWKDCRSCCTFFDLRWMSESEVRDCCPRKMMMSWNRGTPPAPAQILGYWPWRLPFSWRVTWKSDCSHFQGSRTSFYNSVNPVIQGLLSLLSLQGRWVGARREAFLTAFRDWIGEF